MQTLEFIIILLVLLVLASVAGIMLFFYLRSKWHMLNGQFDNLYRQLEALSYVNKVSERPEILPTLRGWALSPDILSRILYEIYQNKPGLVVEFGSGTSSMYIAEALKTVGQGKLIAFDHDEYYCAQTAAKLKASGLDDIATVHHADLKDIQLGNEHMKWYDAELVLKCIEGSIDLIVVDGPPDEIDGTSRYPAFPVLRKHLGEDAVIIVDDTLRKTDSANVDRWMVEDPQFVCTVLETEKGAMVLRRGKE